MLRSKELVLKGSVCEGDFSGNATTAAELRTDPSRSTCRFFPHECPVLQGHVHCIPRVGHAVAEYMVKLGTSVDQEMEDFRSEAPMPPKGYFDPTIEDPSAATTDREEVITRVRQWALKILGIQPIDTLSHNREFRMQPNDALYTQFDVLKESVYDEESSTWTHRCGSMVIFEVVLHPVRLRVMPLAGNGEVVREQVPYCQACMDTPNTHGDPVYQEDLDAAEAAILRHMRDL